MVFMQMEEQPDGGGTGVETSSRLIFLISKFIFKTAVIKFRRKILGLVILL